MSTRERLPVVGIWLIVLVFIAASFSALVSDRFDQYIPYAITDATAGMHRNASGEVVCAHLNTTAGADHTSGTVNVYYHNNSSFVSEGTATHQNQSAGIWCITLSAAATNYNLAKILWQSTGAITLLQTYPTTGYSDNATILDVNVTKVNGTTQSGGRIDANITHINGTATSNGRVDANVTHVTGTAQTAGRVFADVTHVGGSLQTAGDIVGHVNSSVYGLPVIHANTSATPTVEEIDTELSEKHGPGPWTK